MLTYKSYHINYCFLLQYITNICYNITKELNMKKQYLKILTDESYREVQPHGNIDFPFHYYYENVWEFDFHCIAWHWHREIEIIYVKEGNTSCCIATEKIDLPQGYGMFVNSKIMHRYEATQRNILPNIVFSPNLLGDAQGMIFNKFIKPIIESNINYIIFDPNIKWQNEILQILNSIFKLQKTNADYELKITAQLLDLWSILYNNLDLNDTRPRRDILNSSRLQIMMQYMHSNYKDPITLKDIADCVHVSKNSALQIFQKCIRISPFAYLILYRLARAAELLLSTNKNITTIATEVGFESAGYFCRKFKEHYRTSPSQYRSNRLS